MSQDKSDATVVLMRILDMQGLMNAEIGRVIVTKSPFVCAFLG